MRPGLGASGVANLKRFVAEGGLLVTSEDTAQFAIDQGLAPGVSVTPKKELRVVGSILGAERIDRDSPIARGYDAPFALYSSEGLSFRISQLVGGDGNLRTRRSTSGRPVAAACATPTCPKAGRTTNRCRCPRRSRGKRWL